MAISTRRAQRTAKDAKECEPLIIFFALFANLCGLRVAKLIERTKGISGPRIMSGATGLYVFLGVLCGEMRFRQIPGSAVPPRKFKAF